jgi:surfactin synthase thioesterase subunit
MTSTGDWFISRGGADQSSARIFCFPHAGGSPRAFLDWQAGLEGEAEIVAVCRPGREHRAAEPAPSIGEFIAGAAAAISAITAADHRPYYLFGHSLGALVAFEVDLLVAGPDCPAVPNHFIASGCAAPCLLPSQRVKDIAKLEGREFAEAIGFFGGLSAEVIADDEMRELLLPGVIADFHLAVGYSYQAAAPLDVPATLVIGADDPHVRPQLAEPWRLEFAQPPDEHWVPGGHFYFDQDPAVITAILTGIVQADQHVELI